MQSRESALSDDFKELAHACKTIAGYMEGRLGITRQSLGRNPFMWLVKKLVAVEMVGGRWTLHANWRKIMTAHGLNPTTGGILDEGVFMNAANNWKVVKEHRETAKRQARQFPQVLDQPLLESTRSASRGFSPPVLSPLNGFDPMREIRRRL